MKIAIIGTGYVGLVSGACFARLGHEVICIDHDETKISALRNGQVPIYEPGLAELVADVAAAGRLRFSTKVEDAAASGAAIVFIAVGTPPVPADGGANLDYVFAAVESVARAYGARGPSTGPLVLVTKSTVPVGTNTVIERIVARHLPAAAFAIASNPEFLREGSAVQDFLHPDRIVIGSSSRHALSTLGTLYRPLTDGGVPLHAVSSAETAELIKYAANAFLAAKVTFINEVARLSEVTGADIEEVVAGIGSDSRIGHAFLTPGPGYGGSCFPKDTSSLVKTSIEWNAPLSVVEAVIAANQRHMLLMVRKIRKAMGGSLAGKRIGVLGLTFKANTDDMRGAPSLVIVPGLVRAGAVVVAYDPTAGIEAHRLLPEIGFAQSAEEAARDADAVVILTEWPEFSDLDLDQLMEASAERLVIDLRNVVHAERARAFSGRYVGFGRRIGKPDAASAN